MSKTHPLFAAAFVFAVLASCCDTMPVADVSDAERKAVVEGNNAFALDLYAKLRDQEGNLFLSPYSISTALAMTYAGARGNTEKQMADVLHFDLPQGRLHPAFRQLIERMNAQGKGNSYQLSVANALWGQKGYGFLKEFLDLTKASYGAGLREVDFVGATGAARRTINDWVVRKTEGKIKDLIKRGILDFDTCLVLTNAIYFKGNWASRFNERYTKDSPFSIAPDEKVRVPMMYQMRKFRYMEGDVFKALELPYVDNELSMVILLPRSVDGLGELERLLTTENLNKWLGSVREQEVRVYLPRFKMTSEFRLDKVLQSMGMTDAFSGRVDFSGMTGRKALSISAVIHKAFVDVNEEGTEAAAATAVVMKRGGPPGPVFRADHPFILLIRDNRSGNILFVGRLVNPLEASR